MILRKPYALLIKNFKLIHIILVVFMSYLLYRTNFLLKFFNEYLASSQLMELQDFSSQLYNIYMFILPFFVVVFLGILLGIMVLKKKPYMFYLINIAIFIGILIVYTVSLSTVTVLEVELIDVKSVRFIRDIIMIIFVLQVISVFLFVIRAIGFDLKKFDFGQDLAELEIDEKDSEEFEVSLAVDTASIKRGFRRNVRYARYIYLENRFLINLIGSIIVAVLVFVIYFNINIYNKNYNEKQAFMATDFTMMVDKTMISNLNYKGEKLNDEKTLVIVDLKIKRNYSKEIALTTVNLPLVINEHKFYHTNKYRDKIYDLGIVYEKTIIDKKFENILMVYEVPNYIINEEMQIYYIDKIDYTRKGINPKYVKISINPKNIDRDIKKLEVKENEKVKLDEYFFNDGSLEIKAMQIKKEFIELYKFCTSNDCYDAYEYIKPNLNTNYDKAVLRLTGTLENGNTVKNMYDLIRSFGYISYGKNLQQRYYNITKLNPKMISKNNTYYLEVPSAVLNSKQVNLNIRFRNTIYIYKIGG